MCSERDPAALRFLVTEQSKRQPGDVLSTGLYPSPGMSKDWLRVGPAAPFSEHGLCLNGGHLSRKVMLPPHALDGSQLVTNEHSLKVGPSL